MQVLACNGRDVSRFGVGDVPGQFPGESRRLRRQSVTGRVARPAVLCRLPAGLSVRRSSFTIRDTSL